MKILITVVVVLLILMGGALVLILTGLYNVAATAEHTGPVLWAFETLRDNSIQRNAGNVARPAGWDSEASFAHGLSHYAAMCVVCHGGPGVAASEIAEGLYPLPPDLSRSAIRFTPEELFWTVKHGIKMTGMPGFGVNHTDDELWGIVAVLARLPEMTAAEYQQLAGDAEEHGHDGHHRVQPEGPRAVGQAPMEEPEETDPVEAVPSVPSQPADEHADHVHSDDHVH
jgi:mono/diheme cytochrome c family protein